MSKERNSEEPERRWTERDLVRMFIETESCGHHEDRIPMSSADTIVREMAFRVGRADIVVFHVDGTASVIEAKDGTKGYTHVVGGIGQAGLYAAQLGMARPMPIRRCLLWTSTGDSAVDLLIEESCEAAGVVPLPWGQMATHQAAAAEVRRVLAWSA